MKGPEIPGPPQQEKAGPADFKTFLERATEKTAGGAPELQKPPAPVPLLEPAGLSPKPDTRIVEGIERLLDLMELYQRRLGSPQVTLHEIRPLVAQMEAEKDRLASLADTLVQTSPLKDILNHTLVTSSVELMKFDRGDYEGP